jgi:acetyl esterase/lipase
MSGWLFLVASLLGAALTAAVVVRPRKTGVFGLPHFLAGWLVGELALHHVAWQAAATLVFAAFGALETPQGLAGLLVTAGSWGALLSAYERGRRAARPAVEAALAPLGAAADSGMPVHRVLRPFRMKRPGVERIRDLEYGPVLAGDRGRRNRIDVIRPASPPSPARELRPALLQIHGGGWMVGEKETQAQPLLHHLAERGWVCFASNYRLSPQATFPDHIVDVKRAIAWVRAHATEYGADPAFVCITGGSAGGHLAALAALSANDPAYQPGFEEADTRLSAAVPFYGVYDLVDRQRLRGRAQMVPMLAKRVFKCSPEANPDLWENASPLARIHADAPPFLVIHGTHDSLVFVEEARAFVAALREKSRAPVLYAEFPCAQHAFDMFHSPRAAEAVHAVTAFLERVRADFRERARG